MELERHDTGIEILTLLALLPAPSSVRDCCPHCKHSEDGGENAENDVDNDVRFHGHPLGSVGNCSS